MEASTVSWDVHAGEPSTHVLTPPKIGALREVARDNILPLYKCTVCLLERIWYDLYFTASLEMETLCILGIIIQCQCKHAMF